MTSTTLRQLNKWHEQEMLAHVRQTVNNVFSKSYVKATMINDIYWMYEEPQEERQHGRAHRVYKRLNTIEGE